MAVMTYFSHFSKVLLLGLFHVTCAAWPGFERNTGAEVQPVISGEARRCGSAAVGGADPTGSTGAMVRLGDSRLSTRLPDYLAIGHWKSPAVPMGPGISWGKIGVEIVPESRIARQAMAWRRVSGPSREPVEFWHIWVCEKMGSGV